MLVFLTSRVPDQTHVGCIRLNSLANHGFLDFSGRGITFRDVILACFLAFGISPETSSIVTATGLTQKHDCSFSREDRALGNFASFDEDCWSITLDQLEDCEVVDEICFGRAKAARIKAQRQKNPNTQYDLNAAARGVTEAGMLFHVLAAPGESVNITFVRSIFEDERIPRHLGWTPRAWAADVGSVLSFAALSLQADDLLQTPDGGGAKLQSEADIIAALRSTVPIPWDNVKSHMRSAGFDNQTAFEALDRASSDGLPVTHLVPVARWDEELQHAGFKGRGSIALDDVEWQLRGQLHSQDPSDRRLPGLYVVSKSGTRDI
ncbi:peroxidase, family 2 domain-containing protein [Hirsutella rhossiliensis]